MWLQLGWNVWLVFICIQYQIEDRLDLPKYPLDPLTAPVYCVTTAERWVEQTCDRLSSSTAALGDHHSVVLVLVGDCSLVVDVQDGDGTKPCRHAARPARFAWIVGVENGLHDGVLGRRQVVAQREITATCALVRLSPQHMMPCDMYLVYHKASK